jgi:glycosyltransferase involved in cell wall biosynthesis
MSCQLAIIIPAYNEEQTIKHTLLKYYYYFKKRYEFEIIVVMDGCTDSTLYIVKNLSEQYPEIKYLSFEKKLGKGGGIMKGFKMANAKYISFTDADGSTEPRELERLMNLVQSEDGVIGSRWKKGAMILKKESLVRKMASRGFNLMIRIMFNLQYNDTQCGAKVFRDYVINDVVDDLLIKNFSFDIDLLYQIKRKGYSINEIPIKWKHDTFNELKMSKAIPPMFLSIIGLRLKFSIIWPIFPKKMVKSVQNKIETI